MLITKDMGIMEIVQKYPATVEVLQRFGMGCIGCAAATPAVWSCASCGCTGWPRSGCW